VIQLLWVGENNCFRDISLNHRAGECEVYLDGPLPVSALIHFLLTDDVAHNSSHYSTHIDVVLNPSSAILSLESERILTLNPNDSIDSINSSM
jgi:hypothetical protein